MRWVVLLALLAAPAQARTYLLALHNDEGRADELRLRFAEQDADRVVAALQRLGDVRGTDTVVLAEANVEEARAALDAVRERIGREAKPEEAALIVYYSGHADAAGLHLGATTLGYEELRTRVADAPAAVRVLVLDGCRSGGLTRVKGARPGEAFDLRFEPEAVEGMAVMTSSAAGEDSHESDRIGGSFFTHHLVAALVGAGDRNEDGKVTLTEAYGYAYRHTLQSSGRTESLQHPTYSYDIKGRGDFVLTRPGEVESARLRLGEPGTYLVRKGGAKGSLIAELSPERAGASIALPPARYFVQERHLDHYREYEVSLAPRQERKLSGRPYRRVAYARLVRKGGAQRSAHSLYVAGGARLPVLEGRSVAPEIGLTYGLALPWFSLGLRGRFAQSTVDSQGASDQLRSYGAGLLVERVFDWRAFSLGVGLIVEGTLDQQARDGESRQAMGLDFGALLSLEVQPWGPLGLRLEGGPVTHLFPVAQVDNGAEAGSETATRLSAAAAFGLVWRF